ncbi:MAG: DMT family transporter [Sphingobium sp.]
MTHSALWEPAAPRLFGGLLYGIGAGALWGLVFLAPVLVPGFGPIALTVGRYLTYGLVSLLLLACRRRPSLAGVARREWRSLAWLALFGNTLYYILLCTAVQTGGIAMTSLVIGFLPVTVTLIGSRASGAVRLSRLMPSLLLCAGGALCIGWQAFAPADADGTQWIGLGCAIGALAAWTAFAVGNSRCLSRLTHISAQDWNLLIGVMTGAQAVLLLPLAMMMDAPPRAAGSWLHLAGISVAVALIASILGNMLWNRMARLLPLTLVGQMILFETLFALLYAFAWEQRLPTALEAMAFALLIAGVVSCMAAHRPAHRAAA